MHDRVAYQQAARHTPAESAAQQPRRRRARQPLTALIQRWAGGARGCAAGHDSGKIDGRPTAGAVASAVTRSTQTRQGGVGGPAAGVPDAQYGQCAIARSAGSPPGSTGAPSAATRVIPPAVQTSVHSPLTPYRASACDTAGSKPKPSIATSAIQVNGRSLRRWKCIPPQCSQRRPLYAGAARRYR